MRRYETSTSSPPTPSRLIIAATTLNINIPHFSMDTFPSHAMPTVSSSPSLLWTSPQSPLLTFPAAPHPAPVALIVASSAGLWCIIWRVRMTSNALRRKNEPVSSSASDKSRNSPPAAASADKASRRLVISNLDGRWQQVGTVHPNGANCRTVKYDYCRSVTKTQVASRSAVEKSRLNLWWRGHHPLQHWHLAGLIQFWVRTHPLPPGHSLSSSSSSSSSASMASSSAVVLVSIMPRAEPVSCLPAALTHPKLTTATKKSKKNGDADAAESGKNDDGNLLNKSKSLLHRWDFVCDAVAQMLLLPMVCVSICGALGLLLGLECVETLQRNAVLPSLRRTLGAMIRVWGVGSTSTSTHPVVTGAQRRSAVEFQSQNSRQSRRCSTMNESDTRDSTIEANANRLQKQKKEEGGGGDDAGSRRPLKKQRSNTGGRNNNSRNPGDLYGNDISDSNSPLETRPLVHKASAKHKKQTVMRKRRVLIWDLDETLVLFASLYTGAFAQTHGKEIATGVQLGEQMMTFMLAMLERHFFFNDLHDADIDHINCLRNGAALAAAAATEGNSGAANRASTVSLADLSARYERIREIYEREGAVDFLSDERSEWFAIREALVAAIDTFSTGWLREARQVLELLTSNSNHSKVKPATASVITSASLSSEQDAGVEYENINLMVTNTQLAPALCKCLIYQLDAFFPIESVYSSSKLHKQHCFEQIMRKYSVDSESSNTTSSSNVSPSVEFIAIGDGAEEEYVSRALGIQFHKIRSLADLKRLRYDLQLEATSPVMTAVPTMSGL